MPLRRALPATMTHVMSKRAGEKPAEIMAFMRDKQPLGAMMSAADVAGMAVFLLGDRARAISPDVPLDLVGHEVR